MKETQKQLTITPTSKYNSIFFNYKTDIKEYGQTF